ncbi:MAG: hypothetical protein HYU66_24780, partial [Armatimonadetes bacterium]|nr:hypothetical protein [Armatimonadota bacterium]
MTAGDRLFAAQAAAREARHAEVIRLCDEALAVPPAELDAETLSELAFLRADSLWHLGRWAEAAAGFRHICAVEGHEPPLRARVGRAWRLLGEMARRSHAFPEALDAALRAIGAAGELGDDVGLLFGRVALARIYSDVGRDDEADLLLRGILRDAADRLPERSPDRALVVIAARTALGLLLFRRQRLDEALDILHAGADDATRVTHGITLAAWHRQIAIVHEVRQDYSAAVYHLDVAPDLYERVGYEPGRYDVYWSLSLSYTHLGDLSTARLCLEQTQDVAIRLGMQLELGKTKSSFAELALREGDYRAAIGLFRQDILIGRELGDQQALGHCNRKLAECHRIMGELVPAERHAGASVRNFEAMRRLSEASQVRVLLGRVLVEAGRLDEAETCLAQCREQLGPESRPS